MCIHIYTRTLNELSYSSSGSLLRGEQSRWVILLLWSILVLQALGPPENVWLNAPPLTMLLQ